MGSPAVNVTTPSGRAWMRGVVRHLPLARRAPGTGAGGARAPDGLSASMCPVSSIESTDPSRTGGVTAVAGDGACPIPRSTVRVLEAAGRQNAARGSQLISSHTIP